MLGLERFEIGHPHGASEDVSRIIRRSYHRRDYVRLTARAYDAWAEVERESGARIVTRTGGLDVGPREARDGADIDIEVYAAAMTAEGVPFERLDAAEIMRRWPAWRLDEDHAGLYQADTGIADPSHGNAAHRRLAVEHGAELRGHAPVARLLDAGDEVTLELEDGERIRAGRVILATDAWANDLLAPLGCPLPLTVTQEQVSWFTPRADPALFAPGRFPVWIWMDEPSFYGFPTHGHAGPKIGQGVGGRSVTPATRTFERDETAHARTMAFLESRLPGMAVEPFLTKTCLYTMTPDRDFVVDAVPGHPAIGVVLGSAHAYKFASAPGRIMAELAVDGVTPAVADLEAFRIDRPILLEPEPAVTVNRPAPWAISIGSCEDVTCCATLAFNPPSGLACEVGPRRSGTTQGPQEETRMSQPLRGRTARLLAVVMLATTVLLPAAAPAAAADPVVLRVGTTQDLDASNPFNTYLVSGYEAFQLTYNLLVDFDKDAHPGPGFADTWTRNPDNVTFHIRDGMTWSDGQPATSKDACFSWGLALAAVKAEESVGAGYLDPGVKDAGVTKIDCPDASTMVVSTTDQSDRIYQVYVPILPEHIYGKDDYKTIANEKFDPPLVGTGPYTMVEWKTGQFARFERNPTYWGKQGFADQVVLQFFGSSDTMLQALKKGEIDYTHNLNPDQFKQLAADPGYVAVAGKANGWTQLAFNTYGTGTGKTIKGGGPSTKALLDTAFRDALGYAVDKPALVERVLGGFGDVGTTIVPPVLSDWHVEPTTPRTFDIELAKQKLDAAGYKLNGDGKRLDKEGKAISLRLDYPSTDSNYAKSANFVKVWYGQLGIGVTTQAYDSATLGSIVLPSDGKAKYDIELWGWAGNPDPNALLQIFRCDAIDNTSDSQYCNPAYDKLYDLQLTQAGAERQATLAEMQNLIYDEAPYDILYYDSNLDVYRTDRFAGWQNMPENGTPLFTYGILDYTLLTDATAQPSPTVAPAASAEAPGSSGAAATPAPATPAPSADGGTATGSDNTLLLVGVVVLLLVVVVGLMFARRRGGGADDDDE